MWNGNITEDVEALFLYVILVSRLHVFLVLEALVLVGNDLAGAPCGLCLATKPRVNDCGIGYIQAPVLLFRVQPRASLRPRRVTWLVYGD